MPPPQPSRHHPRDPHAKHPFRPSIHGPLATPHHSQVMEMVAVRRCQEHLRRVAAGDLLAALLRVIKGPIGEAVQVWRLRVARAGLGEGDRARQGVQEALAAGAGTSRFHHPQNQENPNPDSGGVSSKGCLGHGPPPPRHLLPRLD